MRLSHSAWAPVEQSLSKVLETVISTADHRVASLRLSTSPQHLASNRRYQAWLTVRECAEDLHFALVNLNPVRVQCTWDTHHPRLEPYSRPTVHSVVPPSNSADEQEDQEEGIDANDLEFDVVLNTTEGA